MGQHRAQVVLGPAVGHHLDAVVAACDQFERGLVRVHGPPLGDRLDRQAERFLEPWLRRRDLDLVPTEEQAVAPILPDLPTFLRAGQAFDDDRRSAGLGPDRQELREIGAARDVRIDVHGDIDSVSARRLDQLESAWHRRPVAPTGDRQMRDLEATPARPRDGERLGHRVEQMVAVVAHMDREQPVVTRDRPADRHESSRSADIAGGYISPVDTPAAPSSRQASMAATSARRSAWSRGRAASPATAIRRRADDRSREPY